MVNFLLFCTTDCIECPELYTKVIFTNPSTWGDVEVTLKKLFSLD